jgi:heme-degrading monooxygenase HmoA
MFLAISRFTVANEMGAEVGAAFRDRPHHVDNAQGFIRMEVANPTDNDQEFWLLTWWQEEIDFQVWHSSHAYRDSHKGMPKGLKLDPERTKMLYFHVVAQ